MVNYSALSDEQLVTLSQNNDTEAISELSLRYGKVSFAIASTFTSDSEEAIVSLDDQPKAVVNAVDPIALHASLADPAETPGSDNIIIPAFILDAMGEDLITVDNVRRWFVTIGQFSMVRLERETQLLIPAYDYFLPDKECPGTSEDDPCALFGRIDFPVDEFFPPDSAVESSDYKQYK